MTHFFQKSLIFWYVINTFLTLPANFVYAGVQPLSTTIPIAISKYNCNFCCYKKDKGWQISSKLLSITKLYSCVGMMVSTFNYLNFNCVHKVRILYTIDLDKKSF